MKKVKITAVRKASYPDLMEKYENPIQHACDIEEGQVWIANGWAKPEGFCDSAWDSISAFVMTLAHLYAVNPETFRFFKVDHLTDLPGYGYICSVTL